MGIFSLRESNLSSKERNELKDSQFGLPEDRKYPLNDADHVRSAIKLFGHCEESKKTQLAKRINAAAKKYGVEIKKDSAVAEYLNEAVLLEASHRKYKCPYCNTTKDRDDLISHIERNHDDMIPKGYTPTRIVFDIVNNKKPGEGFGICRVCKGHTSWNEKTCKYNVLCDNPNCRKALREKAKKNMIKVYGKTTLLDDPEHQQKMLANRSISGTYTFRDGGKITYTGSYEKKALEFFDQVLEVPSSDIMAPGPTLEYEFEGEKRYWITDIYYIPYNLIIEVKDGGDNPNTRDMPIYRGKQYAKEEMITNLGKFNYLRLTNNDFSQLLYIMADMKSNLLDNTQDHTKTNIRINETSGTAAIMGAVPNATDFNCYIINYPERNQISGEDIERSAIAKDINSKTVLALDEKNKVVKKKAKDLLEKGVFDIYRINIPDRNEAILRIKEATKTPVYGDNDFAIFYEMITGKPLLDKDQLAIDECTTHVDLVAIKKRFLNEQKSIKGYMANNSFDNLRLPVFDPKKMEYNDYIERRTDKVYSIKEDMDGYFLYNNDTGARSESHKNIYEVTLELISNMEVTI